MEKPPKTETKISDTERMQTLIEHLKVQVAEVQTDLDETRRLVETQGKAGREQAKKITRLRTLFTTLVVTLTFLLTAYARSTDSVSQAVDSGRQLGSIADNYLDETIQGYEWKGIMEAIQSMADDGEYVNLTPYAGQDTLARQATDQLAFTDVSFNSLEGQRISIVAMTASLDKTTSTIILSDNAGHRYSITLNDVLSLSQDMETDRSSRILVNAKDSNGMDVDFYYGDGDALQVAAILHDAKGNEATIPMFIDQVKGKNDVIGFVNPDILDREMDDMLATIFDSLGANLPSAPVNIAQVFYDMRDAYSSQNFAMYQNQLDLLSVLLYQAYSSGSISEQQLKTAEAYLSNQKVRIEQIINDPSTKDWSYLVFTNEEVLVAR